MALTKRDLNAIKEIVRVEVDEALDIKLEEKLEEKLSGFITKGEFYKTTDKILGELSDLRDEVTLSASHAQADDLEERTAKLEQIHPRGIHASTV